MLCRKCGKEIDENDAFCVYCGASVKRNSSQESTQSQPHEGQVPLL
ncbi:MAG: zinc ribbon domain-containing protein [Lachnospiraceae bacterium]|nr:zinc ribbon domain-containing protein [Lachnospiraceae bacterium]